VPSATSCRQQPSDVNRPPKAWLSLLSLLTYIPLWTCSRRRLVAKSARKDNRKSKKKKGPQAAFCRRQCMPPADRRARRDCRTGCSPEPVRKCGLRISGLGFRVRAQGAGRGAHGFGIVRHVELRPRAAPFASVAAQPQWRRGLKACCRHV